LARPIEKIIEVPVVEVAVKPKKVPKGTTIHNKPQPVQMMAQTPVNEILKPVVNHVVEE